MSDFPKISIIIPTLNQGRFIESTLKSILDQNYPDLQLIVIDGGSTDGTIDIIKKYEGRIQHWVSEKDSGQSSAINKGLSKADGELVNWINSDDMLAEGALHKIASLYKTDKSKNVLIGKTRFLRDEAEVGTSGKIIFENRELTFAMGQINQPATFYRLFVLKELGGINEKLHYCMDVELWLRYLLRFDLSTIAQSDDIWAYFRFHDQSKTISNEKAFDEEKEAIYRTIFEDDKLRNQTNLDLKKANNYYRLWRADWLSLHSQKATAFSLWTKVNPFELSKSERRRYAGVIKNIIFK